MPNELAHVRPTQNARGGLHQPRALSVSVGVAQGRTTSVMLRGCSFELERRHASTPVMEEKVSLIVGKGAVR